MKANIIKRAAAATLACITITLSATAAEYHWKPAAAGATGTWSSAANWDEGNYPSQAGDSAFFDKPWVGSAQKFVYVDTNVTLNKIMIDYSAATSLITNGYQFTTNVAGITTSQTITFSGNNAGIYVNGYSGGGLTTTISGKPYTGSVADGTLVPCATLTLDFQTDVTFDYANGNINLSTYTIIKGNGHDWTINGGSTLTNGSYTGIGAVGTVVDMGGGNIIKTGAGAFTSNVPMENVGAILVQGGTLQFGSDNNRIKGAKLDVSAGAVANFNFGGTTASLTGAGKVTGANTRTIAINTTDNDYVFTGTIDTIGISKYGANKQSIAEVIDVNAVTVNANGGTLIIEKGGSVKTQYSGGGVVTVNTNTALELGGKLSLSGVTSRLNLSNSASLVFDVSSATQYGAIDITAAEAASSFGNTLKLTVDFANSSWSAGTWDLNLFTGVTEAQLAKFTAVDYDSWKGISSITSATYDKTTGILTVISIPEPSTLLLLGIGAGLLLVLRRKKH